MNICFLLGGIQINGGIGRVTSILANQMCSDTDLDITILAYVHENKPNLYQLKPQIHLESLYSHSISMQKALLFGGAVNKTRNILQHRKIDILIACGALFYPLAINACKKTKTKCFCWEHTDPATISDYKFQGWCRRYAVKRCNKLIVLTEDAKKYYLDILKIDPKRLIQIYNPVDNNAAKSKSYDENSKRIISVGRICYQKNYERLIDIAKKVLPDYPEWKWDVYGEGPMHDKIQAMINDAGLQKQITLCGQVDDLYNRYQQYAFMVMTSRYEGFPMSLIEGQINKLPLISFDIPTGPREIITEENGYLIDAEDDEGMIQAIRVLIENKQLRKSFSEKAYLSASRFKMEGILDQWKKCFEQ